VNQTLVMDGENKTLLLIGRNATKGKVHFWLLFILQNLWLSLQWVSRFVAWDMTLCFLGNIYQHCFWKSRQHFRLNHWYPSSQIQCLTSQKTIIWFVLLTAFIPGMLYKIMNS
jgi:hypothetical protein